MEKHPVQVDIIFVGGGTTACVAAGRLAAANPDLRILLIEQGPNNLGEPTVLTPALFLSHLAPNSGNTLFWKGNKSKEVNDRETVVASGGTLGGGSSINFMMYARPTASDFDDWDTPGWGSEELIPLLKKFERYHVAPERDATHGYTGPINISYSDYYAAVAGEYLDVCVEQGIPKAEDIMDLKTGHGCQRLAQYIDPVTGHRQDAAHRYIHTQSHNKHLQIMTQTLVTRVLFDGTKAVGVEVIGNKKQVPSADQAPRTILGRKLVVISAGALGSPVVLQRSGVADATRLTELGIEIVSNLSGVGANYEDHGSVVSTYHVPDDAETLDPFLAQEPGLMEEYMAQYVNGKGFLTTNGCVAGSKLRPTREELKDMGSSFNEVWERYYKFATDKPVMIQGLSNGFLGPRSAIPEKSRFMGLCNIATYPTSRGHIHITSTDPYAPPDFEPGFLKERADVEAHIWAYKKAREIARRMPSFRGEYAPLHPKFPEGSGAACVRLDGPPKAGIKDLIYTSEDDAAIEEFVRQMTGTTWHSLGTIPMRSKEQGGCVDCRLNVHGTVNLKVADLSIIPRNVGANTYSTALLVGEKAAVLIAEDLGLKLD